MVLSYDLLFQRCCPQPQLWTLNFYLVSCTQWGLLIIFYFKFLFHFFWWVVPATELGAHGTKQYVSLMRTWRSLSSFVTVWPRVGYWPLGWERDARVCLYHW